MIKNPCKNHPDREGITAIGGEHFDGAEMRFKAKYFLCAECDKEDRKHHLRIERL